MYNLGLSVRPLLGKPSELERLGNPRQGLHREGPSRTLQVKLLGQLRLGLKGVRM